MPNIVVGIVYLEVLAKLNFIKKKLITKNSPPPPQKKKKRHREKWLLFSGHLLTVS